MIKVSNKPCIRYLASKSFKVSKNRNIIAIIAIVLTTILFTSLFTVSLSINEALQQANFRQVGGYAHGCLKNLTEEQYLELREDPLIDEWGVSRVLGFAQNEVLRKNHVEVRWFNPNSAHWMYLDPVVGRLPTEGTDEAAADTELLRLLGVEPKLGAEFTVLIDVCGKPTEQTFTLCGWWDKDPIVVANMVFIPESRVNSVLDDLDVVLPTDDNITGSWNLDVMFKNSHNIEENLNSILSKHSYQSESAEQPNYISTGVNWGYTSAQFLQNADGMTIVTIILLLLLIGFTGYLIIYNVFQISVAGDIRYYGLLKTIGTTGKQIKSILRQQAALLSLIGIPIGSLLGWLIGAKISPIILSRLNDVVVDTVSVSPVIFVGATLFAILTVFFSCARPARLASKVSPVEAVSYTEGRTLKKKQKKGIGRISILSMAWSNLGRNKVKTAITILSLTLAVVLLQMTTLFTNGFDIDKYLRDKSSCDFILADGGYFNNNVMTWRIGKGIMPEDVISEVNEQGGILDGGRIYGQIDAVQEFAPEEWVIRNMLHWGNSENSTEYAVSNSPHTGDGRVMDSVHTYGMEPFVLDALNVIEGDLSGLYESGSRAIAAVCGEDDYGNVEPDSHWAKVGDKVTLRVPESWEYYSPETGEVHNTPDAFGDQHYLARPAQYHDEIFTVEALVLVPNNLSYRYYGSDEFVLNAETFQEITGKSDVMLYAFDVAEGTESDMEEFLHHYTETINTRYSYESKLQYINEFNSFRSMFLIVGGLLSFIVGLVGILNFVNAVLTGIISRKREFAMLQSIGMTGKQLKSMLVVEGLLYALSSVLFAFVFSLSIGPLAASVFEKMFWFFTERPTFIPIIIVAPIFALVGCLAPLLVYRSMSKQTIVERLRESEG